MKVIIELKRAAAEIRGLMGEAVITASSLYRGRSSSNRQRGVALLSVLWLTVALSFMAMATAQLVRTEVSAASNQIDSQRGYYLARGGIEAAIYAMAFTPLQDAVNVPDEPSRWNPGKRWLQFQLAGGSCTVEVIPENAKLNINQVSTEQLSALFLALGAPPDQSLEMAAAIVDWRSPRTSDVGSTIDAYYSNLAAPYRARHAALEQVDELLPVRGMTPGLFFGRTEHNPEGEWRKWPALADLLTTQATGGQVNPNYASYEVIRSFPGWDDEMAAAIVTARQSAPFRTYEELTMATAAISSIAANTPFTLAQNPVYTLTATGFVPGSQVRRSVRALVLLDPKEFRRHRVLGWWDEWPSPGAAPRLDKDENENVQQPDRGRES